MKVKIECGQHVASEGSRYNSINKQQKTKFNSIYKSYLQLFEIILSWVKIDDWQRHD
jgi:hypothetical protein